MSDKYAMCAIDVELYNVCAKGSLQEVERLLEQGANPSAPHWVNPWADDLDPSIYMEDYYCVHVAAMNPDVRVLDALIKHGADPNAFEDWRRQPLAYAGRYNSLEMVRRLVELGNDPGNNDLDGGTVLSWAALNPDIRVLEYLMEHGAEVGETCLGGTELDIALKEGTPDRIRFFVEHGSDLKYLSAYSLREAPIENIRTLLECGLDPNFEDEFGDGRLVDILDPVRSALFVEFGAKGENETKLSNILFYGALLREQLVIEICVVKSCVRLFLFAVVHLVLGCPGGISRLAC